MEVKAAGRGRVHRSLADGSAIVMLGSGAAVLVLAAVVGTLYPLQVGALVEVDLADDNETVLNIAIVKE